MRPYATAFAAVLPLLALFPSEEQTSQRSSIRVTVFDLQSEQPLQDAVITLFSDRPPIRGVTDASGRFTFEGLLSGEYRIGVSRDGYLRSAQDSRATIVSLTDAQAMQDVSLRLLRTSVISGRVLNENGDPLRADVRLMRREYRNGRHGLFPVSATESARLTALTDRNGEYRLYGVEPGQYYLRLMMEVPAYYPGVTDTRLAVPITVAPGKDLTSIDFKLRSEPLHSVRLTVLLPENEQLGRANWFIMPRDTDSPVDFVSSGEFALVGANRYQSPGLRPGAYELQMIRFSPPLFGHLAFDVKDQDDDVGTMSARAGIDVTGQFRGLDGPLRELLPKRISFTSANGWALTRTGTIAADGTFIISNVPAGDFLITIDGLPPDAYVQAVRYGGQHSDSPVISLRSNPEGPAEIVIASVGGAVTGTLLGDRRETVANGHIVIFPMRSNGKWNATLVRAAETDRYGLFSFRGLPPGNYRALAWRSLPHSYQDPEFLRRYEAEGMRISVTQGGATTVELRVQVETP